MSLLTHLIIIIKSVDNSVFSLDDIH